MKPRIGSGFPRRSILFSGPIKKRGMNWCLARRKFRALFQKREMDAEMDAEIRSHLEMQTQENIEDGMTPEEARYTALRQFGWTESIKETCRDQRGVSWIEDLGQDTRYAARMLRKNLSFTAVAVITLALGIGATTVIFSVINGVLLRPLPYDQSAQLVNVWETTSGGAQIAASGGAFTDWKKHCTSFEELATLSIAERNLTGDGSPERISGWRVSASFLRVFRVTPALGRDFSPNEDQDSKVVILSHRLWQRRYGGNRELVDHEVRLDGESHLIIGVLPPKALLSEAVDFLVPFAVRPGMLESARHIQSFH